MSAVDGKISLAKVVIKEREMSSFEAESLIKSWEARSLATTLAASGCAEPWRCMGKLL